MKIYLLIVHCCQITYKIVFVTLWNDSLDVYSSSNVTSLTIDLHVITIITILADPPMYVTELEISLLIFLPNHLHPVFLPLLVDYLADDISYG